MKKSIVGILCSIFLFSTTIFAHDIDLESHVEGDTLMLHWQNITDTQIPEILDFLSKHSEIKALDLTDNSALTTNGIIKLSEINTISSLSLAYNNIQNKGIIALANNLVLKSLDLKGVNLQKAGITALANNKTLTTLHISIDDFVNNTLDDIAMIANNSTLATLEVYNDLISDEDDHSSVGKLFESNKSLTTLKLSHFMLGDGAKYFKDTHLIELSLSDDHITDEAVIALAKNNTLKILDVTYNELSEKGIIALANNPSLQELRLYPSPLSEAAILALAKSHLETLAIGCFHCEDSTGKIGDVGAIALAKNSLIKNLYAGWENISSQGAIALAKNTTLEYLDLNNNNIDDEGAIALAHNESITSLSLRDNDIGPLGTIALSGNTILKKLNLAHTHIGLAGAIALAKNTTLIYLNVSDSYIPEEGLRALASNHSIKCIVVYTECNDNDVDLKSRKSNVRKGHSVKLN